MSDDDTVIDAGDHRVAVGAVAFALGALLALACWWAAGTGLGLYMGGVALATLVAPALVLGARGWRARLMVYGGVVNGIGAVWLVAAIVAPDVSLLEWLACDLILVAYVGAIAGLAVGLERIVKATASSAIVTISAMLWLTWPVWLAPVLASESGRSLVGVLVPVHPLLAINGVLAQLGPWPERHLAYQLMNLGQDVPYRLQSQPWVGVLAHLVAGGLGLVLLLAHLRLTDRRRRRVRPAIDVPDRSERDGGQQGVG